MEHIEQVQLGITLGLMLTFILVIIIPIICYLTKPKTP